MIKKCSHCDSAFQDDLSIHPYQYCPHCGEELDKEKIVASSFSYIPDIYGGEDNEE